MKTLEAELQELAKEIPQEEWEKLTDGPARCRGRGKIMVKYIIKWDTGYSMDYDVTDAKSLEDAEAEAYERWKEDAESNADYGAEEYTDELAEDYGL